VTLAHFPALTESAVCVCVSPACRPPGPSTSAPQSTPQTILPQDSPLDTTPAPPTATGSSPQGPHMVEFGPPVMYSVYFEDQGAADAAGLNMRASWLAGRRVYGPVLFAGCGIMRGAVSSNSAWISSQVDLALCLIISAAAHPSTNLKQYPTLCTLLNCNASCPYIGEWCKADRTFMCILPTVLPVFCRAPTMCLSGAATAETPSVLHCQACCLQQPTAAGSHTEDQHSQGSLQSTGGLDGCVA
jgi:hypothetical protein